MPSFPSLNLSVSRRGARVCKSRSRVLQRSQSFPRPVPPPPTPLPQGNDEEEEGEGQEENGEGYPLPEPLVRWTNIKDRDDSDIDRDENNNDNDNEDNDNTKFLLVQGRDNGTMTKTKDPEKAGKKWLQISQRPYGCYFFTRPSTESQTSQGEGQGQAQDQLDQELAMEETTSESKAVATEDHEHDQNQEIVVIFPASKKKTTKSKKIKMRSKRVGTEESFQDKDNEDEEEKVVTAPVPIPPKGRSKGKPRQVFKEKSSLPCCTEKRELPPIPLKKKDPNLKQVKKERGTLPFPMPSQASTDLKKGDADPSPSRQYGDADAASTSEEEQDEEVDQEKKMEEELENEIDSLKKNIEAFREEFNRISQEVRDAQEDKLLTKRKLEGLRREIKNVKDSANTLKEEVNLETSKNEDLTSRLIKKRTGALTTLTDEQSRIQKRITDLQLLIAEKREKLQRTKCKGYGRLQGYGHDYNDVDDFIKDLIKSKCLLTEKQGLRAALYDEKMQTLNALHWANSSVSNHLHDIRGMKDVFFELTALKKKEASKGCDANDDEYENEDGVIVESETID